MRIPFGLSIRAVVPSRGRLFHFFCLLATLLACGASIHATTLGYFVSTQSIAFADGNDNTTISYNSNTGSFTQFLVGDSTATGSSVLSLTSAFDQTTAADPL